MEQYDTKGGFKLTGGEFLYRATYEGKRAKRRGTVKKDQHGGSLMVRTMICMVLGAALWAAGTFIPGVKETAAKYIGGSLDYRAAFSAAGEAIAGERRAEEVWSALVGEDETVDTYVGEIAASGDITYSVTTLDDEQTAEQMNEKAREEYAGIGMVPPEEYSEQLLPFPAGENAGEEDAPDTVSYDYLVFEFDYEQPLEGTVTSGFGYRIHPVTKKLSFHYGIDIGAPMGSDIIAFADGTVELVGYNSTYGNYLFIRHRDGIISFYGHCSSIDVCEGQLVKMGEAVAAVGSTGISTGPHLHFEVRSGDTILDPSLYVYSGEV